MQYFSGWLLYQCEIMDLDLSPDDSDDESEDFSGVSDDSGDSNISEIEDER